jgi:hypothetical protein
MLNLGLKYLSSATKDDVERGCTFAEFGSDLARDSEKTRQVASKGPRPHHRGLGAIYMFSPDRRWNLRGD